jgi:YhcH/YjgK/YiaL family protein
MIIDQLRNTNMELYAGLTTGAGSSGLRSRIQAALHYLQTADLANLPVGKVEIDGTQVYAMIQAYDTKPRAKGFWEAHRRYIDVQYVVQGEELMGYANLAQLTAGEYEAKSDFLPLHGQGNFLKLPAGMFTIFTPEDAHMPGIALEDQPQPVKKVVVKVAVADA